MPTYQFVCNDCGKDFEFFLTRFVRDTDKVCPSCGGTNVKQAYREVFGFASSRSSGGGDAYYGGGSSGSNCSSSG